MRRASAKSIIPNSLIRPFNLLRSGVYFLESIPLRLVGGLGQTDDPAPTKEQLQTLWSKIFKLYEREEKLIQEGIYSKAALEIENPIKHFRSYLEVMGDGVGLIYRRSKKQNKSFSKDAQELMKDVPEYYARNFHFQTDGYLSEASARRYDHQVDILFAGTTGAMRRMILEPLKRLTSGKGHWLELGCGAGSATKPVLENFPEVKVTALDMSPPYLKVAQSNLRDFSKVSFIQGDGANLDFKSDTFDAVFSVYVLHELPREERVSFIREAYRVIKPGGVMVLADSIQTNDDPDFNWSLEAFPKHYHEPFYKDYINHDLKKMIKQITGLEPNVDFALSTKVVWLQKPPSSALS